MSDVASTVIAAIAKVKRMPEEKITPESRFEELGVDSLDSIEILFELEEAFDLSVEDEAVQGMESVGQVIEAIEEAKAERGEG